MHCTTPALFRYCAVLLFAVPACFADVTASISGFVDANGQAQDSCVPEFFGCNFESDSFSFSDSNTQPLYSFSQTGSASAGSDPSDGAGVGATITQMEALSSGHLSTSLEADDYVYASNLFTFATVDAVDQNTTTFESTGTFLLHVTA